MTDIIRLLPETVANQIAAGEVVQRPSSAVKELIENSIDAGSTSVELYIKEAGKGSIHIVDNGSGMSATDARLSFGRHATSKIRSADDLFSIRTMGFRGEALASIAAVAQVEMRTRRTEDELGTSIIIEGNELKSQEPVSCSVGTSIIIKNLFFNVPARRNFLKSNPVETRHIIEEFERVAIAHPHITFKLQANGVEIFNLPVSNTRQRLVNIYGTHYNERLVPVEEQTTLLSINGYIGKPEFSKKTRGEQYLYVNNRFIKDNYLNHAVMNAFEDILPKGSFASYWLFIDIDPSKIDVNIHPTKTEIKFEDERSVYAIVRSAVKRSLGQYHIQPAIDFEQEKTFDVPYTMRHQPAQKPAVTVNTGYNPFNDQKEKKIVASGWERVMEDISNVVLTAATEQLKVIPQEESQLQLPNHFIQTGNYLIGKIENGLLIVDAIASRQRLLYNKYLKNHTSGGIQQQLFPVTIHFNAGDSQLVNELESDLRMLGFDLRLFGGNSFVLHGCPEGIEKGREVEILEEVIEQCKNNSSDLHTGIKEKLSRSLAEAVARKKNIQLSSSEIQLLVMELFSSEDAVYSLSGKPCYQIVKTEELGKLFFNSNR